MKNYTLLVVVAVLATLNTVLTLTDGSLRGFLPPEIAPSSDPIGIGGWAAITAVAWALAWAKRPRPRRKPRNSRRMKPAVAEVLVPVWNRDRSHVRVMVGR